MSHGLEGKVAVRRNELMLGHFRLSVWAQRLFLYLISHVEDDHDGDTGYQFKVVDTMVTNFHLPKSTLLMLVSAFVDREKILETYEIAIREGYRFYSFGDAMLIL